MNTQAASPAPYLATANVILAIIAVIGGAAAYFLYEILVALQVIVALT
jgi:hypothetical protein